MLQRPGSAVVPFFSQQDGLLKDNRGNREGKRDKQIDLECVCLCGRGNIVSNTPNLKSVAHRLLSSEQAVHTFLEAKKICFMFSDRKALVPLIQELFANHCGLKSLLMIGTNAKTFD